MSWEEIIAASAGEYSVYCRVAGTSVSLMHRANIEVESASTIKLPILLALLDAAQHKEISMRKRIDLKRSHVGRGGSGLLQSMYFNTPFTLYNLAFLMMAVSDNVATNAIIELLGKDAINTYFSGKLKLKTTRLVMDKLDFPAGYTVVDGPNLGLTTAGEMGALVHRLTDMQLLDPYFTRLTQRFMAQVQRSTFNRRLPAKAIRRFGSKTGWLDPAPGQTAILNECGYIVASSRRQYSFAIMSRSPLDLELPYSQDSTARAEFAVLSRALFDALESAK